jgi:hypothetical protein
MAKKLIISILIYCYAITNYGQSAFKGAEGFGSVTRGAYGGSSEPRVLIVDDLRDASIQTSSSSGTLRWCVSQTYPRIVLFNVSGVIELASEVRIGSPYISIYGQSAPDKGITIKGSSFYLRSHDIIIQHLKSRVGDGSTGSEMKDRDGLSIGHDTYNIIIDHCSFSWAIDENFDIYGENIRDITVSNCIISEGLYNSAGYTSQHSYGMLVGFGIKNLSVIKDLFVNNLNRNPLISNLSEAEVINCLIYNANKPGVDTDPAKVSVVGCISKPGPESGDYSDYIVRIRSGCTANCDFHAVYVKDNIYNSKTALGVINESTYDPMVDTPPIWSGKCNILKASETEQYLIKNAGAFYYDRDDIDKRIIYDLINGTGSYITTPSQAGGYGTISSKFRNILNHSGYPKYPHQDSDNNGFTNLEDWLQTLPLSEDAVSITPVTNVTVTSAGGVTTIYSSGGTLQLNAVVSPGDATNKAVTWSIANGTGQAMVNSSGLITAVGNGTITVKATAMDGSGASDTMEINISGQLIQSVDPEKASEMIVYPNPSTGKFFVRLSDSIEEAILEIRNQAGRLVLRYPRYSNAFDCIDMSSQPKGIYLISLIGKSLNAVQKITLF